jgi:hypothetical protein
MEIHIHGEQPTYTVRPSSAQASPLPPKAAAQDLGTQIVVLDRGFVYVGKVTISGDFVLIEDAKNLRVWGTTKGLGELRDGPTGKTVTDDAGTVRAPLRALISLIEVGGRWLS